jgi:hypothetical protein
MAMSIRALAVALSLVLMGCAGGSTPSADGPTATQEETTPTSIPRDASELVVGASTPVQVTLEATVSRSAELDVLIFWREDSQQRRIDIVNRPKDGGDPHGTLIFESRNTSERIICDWDNVRRPDAFMRCFENVGTAGRDVPDFVYLLTNGSVKRYIDTQTFAGNAAGCYEIRYVWMLAPQSGKLCVSSDLGVPLFLGNAVDAWGFEAVDVERPAAADWRPTVPMQTDSALLPLDLLRLPEEVFR